VPGVNVPEGSGLTVGGGVVVSVDDPEGAVEGEEVIKGVGDVAMLAGF